MNVLLRLMFQDDDDYESLVDVDLLDVSQRALIQGALEEPNHTVHTDGDTMVELVIDIEHTAGVAPPASVAHSVTFMEIDDPQYEQDTNLFERIADQMRSSE